MQKTLNQATPISLPHLLTKMSNLSALTTHPEIQSKRSKPISQGLLSKKLNWRNSKSKLRILVKITMKCRDIRKKVLCCIIHEADNWILFIKHFHY